jgi:hypothetical protein
MLPRMTLVSDSRCRGVSLGPTSTAGPDGGTGDVADLGNDDRAEYPADAGQCLGRLVAVAAGQQLSGHLIQHESRERPRGAGGPLLHGIKTWGILRKLRCCPWRAGQIAKAIHVLQTREIAE